MNSLNVERLLETLAAILSERSGCDVKVRRAE